MDFYTSAVKSGDNILIRGYDKGQKVARKIKYSPSLFVKNKGTQPTPFKTIFGESLSIRNFDTMKEATEWVKTHENIPNLEIYGNDKYLYQYLGDEFRGKQLNADYDLLSIITWDIETTVELGKFPSPIDAAERIQLVTVEDHHTKKMTTWGLHPWTPELKCDEDDYIECGNDEALLITKVIFWFNENKPDILTGWSTDTFDNPYFVNRAKKIVGDMVNKMSPWGRVYMSEKEFNGKMELHVDIVGIVSLDYIDLYKKFSPKKQENYKLDHIGFVELKMRKIDFEGTFKEFYTNDWNLFVKYNRVDTEIVSKLEDKLKLIRLAIMLGHDALSKIEDALGTVQIWDCIIYNHLMHDNVIVPLKNNNPFRFIKGAYVKPPFKGVYKWAVTFDATSLYPSIMMAANISPETLVEDEKYNGDVSDFIKNNVKINTKHSVLANGHMFRNDKKGFIPILVERVFNDRVVYKDLMKDAKRELEKVREEIRKRQSS